MFSPQRCHSGSDLQEARRLYRAGEFARCHAVLDELANNPTVVFERAKLLLRERKFTEALEPLQQIENELAESEKAEWCILLGAAYCYAGDFARGEHYFYEADGLIGDRNDLKFLLANQRGVAAWMLHDDQTALRQAEVLETSDDPNHRALGHSLSSWVAVRRGDTMEQAKLLVRALEEFEKATERDDVFIARTLLALAALCREMPFPKGTKRLRTMAANLRWTGELALEHFQVTRILGWIDALTGDELASFRMLKRSAELAPSKAWKVLSLLDRAYIAKSKGEQAFALDQLYDARHLAAEVAWEQTHGEERSALLILAELFASVDPGEAKAYLERFTSLPPSVHPMLVYAADRRVAAFRSYSAGMAYKELGDPAAALAALTDAWNTFETYSYGWRAALSAASIYELTSARTWLARARSGIVAWPNSWLARVIGRLDDEKPATVKLTSTQRRVYDALLDGHSTGAIANWLGRSPNTVRNHIAAIFLAFHVNSRAQLLSKSFELSALRSAEQTLNGATQRERRALQTA